MADTIEKFVAKLQAEGVEAGRQEADKLRAQARAEADQLLADARKQAEGVLADAGRQAEELKARTGTELRLAARDTVARLREALNRALEAVLAHASAGPLNDPDFVAKVLHELVTLYAKSDAAAQEGIRINVNPEMRERLSEWAIGELHRRGTDGGLSIDLKGSLASAGFEYSVSGATVEITVGSIVQMLSGLVSPMLGQLLNEAASAPGSQR